MEGRGNYDSESLWCYVWIYSLPKLIGLVTTGGKPTGKATDWFIVMCCSGRTKIAT